MKADERDLVAEIRKGDYIKWCNELVKAIGMKACVHILESRMWIH